MQTAFVDNPSSAVGDADRLVTQVMRERGYPIDDFDQRAADISVDHPNVVEHYRAAHVIYLAQQQGDVGTEAQREAFVHYRALFEKLLETDPRPKGHAKGGTRMTTHDQQTKTTSNSTDRCRPSCTGRIFERGDGTIDRTNRTVGRGERSFVGEHGRSTRHVREANR